MIQRIVIASTFDLAATSAAWAQRSVTLFGRLDVTAEGTVRLSRFSSDAYFAAADWIGFHNHNTGNSSDGLYAYLGRNTNKVAYLTPELMKGLTAGASISAGEGGRRLRNHDGSINHTASPLTLGASDLHATLDQAGKYDKLANPDARQLVLAYNENLSKRTEVYTFCAKVTDEKGVSAYGGDFSPFAFSVRHNF